VLDYYFEIKKYKENYDKENRIKHKMKSRLCIAGDSIILNVFVFYLIGNEKDIKMLKSQFHPLYIYVLPLNLQYLKFNL
jgi:hypothetical protein